MRTRREQVQAYRFVTRRIVSALLSGDPETNDLPMRRLGLAVFGSAMVAAIVLAAVGVIGLVTHSGAELEANTLVIERETGAKFVYVDERLYPVLNYASARLVLGDAAPEIRTMSQASLKGVPRGQTIGIPDAPITLPAPSLLAGLPWRVCNVPPTAESPSTSSRVVVGVDLPAASDLGADGLLVISGETRYLLWNNLRLPFSGGRPALAALEFSSVTPIPVGQQLLNAIELGPNLETIPIPGSGELSERQIDNKPAWLGQVFRSGTQYYVMTRDGLSPIGEISAKLRLAGGGGIREITAAAAGGALSQTRVEPEGYPQDIPKLRNQGAAQPAVCASYRGGTTGASLEVFDQVPDALSSSTRSVVARQTSRDPVRVVDRMVVGGGRGALVQALPAPGATAPGTTVYLLTDEGIKYALTTTPVDAKTALGYADVKPVLVPAAVIALVPTGPPLDATAARQFFTGTDTGGVGGVPAATPAPTGSAAAAGHD